MIVAILLHFCDSYLISLIVAPHHLPRCWFRHPVAGDSH